MSTRLARLVRLVRTWRTWRMLLLVPAVSCAGDEGCQPARDGRCQFPFVMNNMTLHSCTWYRSYGTGGYPWCATQGEAGVQEISDLIRSRCSRTLPADQFLFQPGSLPAGLRAAHLVPGVQAGLLLLRQ